MKEMGHGRNINVSEARKQLFDIINRVNKEALPYTITINGEPEAVLMSKDDYDAWTATIETLCDKDLMDAIKEGDKDIKNKRVSNWEDVKKEIKINTDVSDSTLKQVKKRTKKTR